MSNQIFVGPKREVIDNWIQQQGIQYPTWSRVVNNKTFAAVHYRLSNAQWTDGKEYAQIDFCVIVTDSDAILIRAVKSDERNGSFALLHPNGTGYLTESGQYETWNKLFNRAKQKLHKA